MKESSWRLMEVGEPIIKVMPSRLPEWERSQEESSPPEVGKTEDDGMLQKRGQNCNNSCPLLRNTKCFPAI